VVRNIIDATNQFLRPENLLARSEKNFIWAVPFDDLLVQEIYSSIESVINENIAVFIVKI
jgi:hypothetical protein